MKLVHWQLMGGLLHFVQRGGDLAGPQPTQALPRCTKCNSPLINGQCTIQSPYCCIMARCSAFEFAHKGLTCSTVQRGRAVPKNRNRFDGTSNLSVTTDTEAGSISAGVTSPADGHAAHDGQRRHFLRSSLPLHLYLQVSPA